MKNILIATDFSPAARCATRYGIKLAAALNAKVSLVCAYEPLPVPVPDDPMIMTPDDMEDVVMEQLTKEADLFALPGIPHIDVFSRKGATAEAILAVAKEWPAHLIITGMKEHGKEFRRLFGSAVTGLANKTFAPVLVVPEGTEYQAPTNIVIANDFVPKTQIGIPPFLRWLAAEVKSKLTVIRFLGHRAAEVIEIVDYSSNLRRITGVISPLEEVPYNGHATDMLTSYLAEHHSNLLAMPVHHQSLMERWLAGNPAREVIFETRVPFLLLPENSWS
ncbi:MAG TPA: universal stress protein [Puia sp.]|nr:universal stress protein [Puia sp.]